MTATTAARAAQTSAPASVGKARAAGSRVVRVLRRMTPRSLFTWPAILVITLWSIAFHLFGGGSTLHGSVLARIAITLAATAVMFAVLALVAFAVLPHCGTALGIAVSLVALVVSAAIRAYVLQILLIAFGLREPDAQVTMQRVMGGTQIMAMTLIATAYIASLFAEAQSRRAALEAENMRLAATLAESSADIRQQQEAGVERVRNLLTEHVAGLPLDSADAALASLTSLTGDVVRPMSHELARDVKTWQPPDTEAMRVTWSGIWQHVNLEGAARPLLVSAIIVFNGIAFSTMFYDGRTVMLMFVIGTPLLVGSLVIVRRMLSPVVNRLPSVWRAVGITVALVLAATPTAILLDALSPPGPWDHLFTMSVLTELPFVGWLSALATAGLRELNAVTDELDDVQIRLRWQVARSRMTQWYQQRQLSRALHGPVQTELHAAMRRIKAAIGNGTATAVMPGERDRLQTAVTELLTSSDDALDVRDVLRDTAALWDGVTTVDVTLADDVERSLAADQACAVTVSDITQEAVSNAIRHGDASAVSIVIDRPSADAIGVHVADNGHVSQGASRVGLGTQQLDDCSIEWSRELTDHGSTLRAVLPFDAAPSAS